MRRTRRCTPPPARTADGRGARGMDRVAPSSRPCPHSSSLKFEVDDDGEIDIHRLTGLHPGLVAPLHHSRHCRRLESTIAGGRAQDFDITYRSVLANDGLYDDTSPDNVQTSLPGEHWIHLRG